MSAACSHPRPLAKARERAPTRLLGPGIVCFVPGQKAPLVDPVANLAVQKGLNVGGHAFEHTLARAAAAPGAMRGHDQVRNSGIQQRMIGRRRFLIEHVQCRATDLAVLECGNQRRAVDDRTAGGVDQECGVSICSSTSLLSLLKHIIILCNTINL